MNLTPASLKTQRRKVWNQEIRPPLCVSASLREPFFPDLIAAQTEKMEALLRL